MCTPAKGSQIIDPLHPPFAHVSPDCIFCMQDAFVKTCRKKAQLISEDDLFVDGQFMSEQDMIDEGFKEYPVCIM